jgi:putative membrane protein
MVIDLRVFAPINLVVQLLLVATILVAAYLAKRRSLKKHCAIMRVALPLQIISIAFVMLPSMLGYVRVGQPGSAFSIEIWIHHALGLAVVALWIYINLVVFRVIKTRHSLIIPMRLALVSWLITLITGIHLYLVIWV